MALIAYLQFGDNDAKLYSRTYNVCDVKCHIGRHHTQYQPDGRALCHSIDVTVVAPGREDLTLIDWYVRRSAMTGRIAIAMTEDASFDSPGDKEILFDNAVCFGLAEDYHIDNDRRRLLTLSFQPEELTLDNVVFGQ